MSIKQKKKELWKIFSLYIRLRDSNALGYGQCITFDCVEHYKEMDAGHCIPSTYLATAFNECNVNMQCRTCNRSLGGMQPIYRQRVDERYGKGTMAALDEQKHKPVIFTANDYQEMINQYKQKVKELWQGQ